jgi:hypothetical protein
MSQHAPLQRRVATPTSTSSAAHAPATISAHAPPAAEAPRSFGDLERAARAGHRLADIPVRAPSRPGTGRPLPAPVRAKMEGSFGHGFSDVRVHEDDSAESIGATAYTRGRDVHFARGRYQPQTASGQALLGHELTHVVQQRAGKVAVPQGKGAPINADSRLEAEADAQGSKAARGEPVTVRGVGGGVQRKAETGGGGVIQCQGKKKPAAPASAAAAAPASAATAAASFVASQANNHHKTDSGSKGKKLGKKKAAQYAATSQKKATAKQEENERLAAAREAKANK